MKNQLIENDIKKVFEGKEYQPEIKQRDWTTVIVGEMTVKPKGDNYEIQFQRPDNLNEKIHAKYVKIREKMEKETETQFEYLVKLGQTEVINEYLVNGFYNMTAKNEKYEIKPERIYEVYAYYKLFETIVRQVEKHQIKDNKEMFEQITEQRELAFS